MSESFVTFCHSRCSAWLIGARLGFLGASPEVLPASRVGVTLKARAALQFMALLSDSFSSAGFGHHHNGPHLSIS